LFDFGPVNVTNPLLQFQRPCVLDLHALDQGNQRSRVVEWDGFDQIGQLFHEPGRQRREHDRRGLSADASWRRIIGRPAPRRWTWGRL
jgi:hypothetical protein